MAFYLVGARLRPDALEELARKLADDAFLTLQPFGRALTRGLLGARLVDGTALWEEEDYCSPPLAQERRAVLDRYFDDLEVEIVEEGEGWRRIAHLPRLFSGSMDPFMQAAIAEAKLGLTEGGIPIGSVLVHRGRILGRGHNRRVQQGSAILHGEMDALENAGRQPAAVYRASVLYTTLSPCAMCSGAILLYGIPKIVVGENVSFMGEEDLLRSRGVQVQVLQDPTCMERMRSFIAQRPDLWGEDIGVMEEDEKG